MNPMTFNTDFTKVAGKDDMMEEDEIDESVLSQGHSSIIEEWMDKDTRKLSIDKNKTKEMLHKMLEEI